MINCTVSITQLMFDTFDAGAVYVANTASLTAFSSGTLDGVVFECGYDTSYITPVYDGICLRFATPKVKCFSCPKQWRIQGGARDTPPLGPNSFIFMQFWQKICKIIGRHTLLGSWRRLGNPGSATAKIC